MRFIEIKSELGKALEQDTRWKKALEDALANDQRNVHLAIFVEPFLSYLLDGSKTVESRFSKNRISPYGKIKSGDLLLIKKSGGPISAIAKVGHCWFYEVEQGTMQEIRSHFAQSIRAEDDSFWESKSQAKYVSLMQIVQLLAIAPVSIHKQDRRGWVTFTKD